MAVAQTVTITEYNGFPGLKKIKWVWTSATGGAVVGAVTTNKYTGELVRLITVPATGDDAPSDNYNITIKDDDGADALISAGLLRDTANTEQVIASSLGAVYDSKLTLAIDSAGDANGGTVYLYIKDISGRRV